MHFLRVSTLTLLLAAVIVSCHRKTSGDKATQLNKPKEPNEYVESKPLIGEPEDSSMLEYNLMDPIDIVPGVVLNPDSLKPYNASHTFEHDLLHTKIEISTIRKIYRTNNPLSSPALSLDRIAVVYNKFDEILISPKERNEFINELLKINPSIEVKD